MTLTETKIIDQITVTEDGTVLYREATRILKDGEQIAHTYHRSILKPGSDLATVPPQVAAIANAAWTQEVIDAFNQAVTPTPFA